MRKPGVLEVATPLGVRRAEFCILDEADPEQMAVSLCTNVARISHLPYTCNAEKFTLRVYTSAALMAVCYDGKTTHIRD